MKYLRTGLTVTTLSLSALALTSPAFGQGSGGRQGVLSFGQGFDYDFKDGLETTTDLALRFSTSTRSETFDFGIGTQLLGDFTETGTDKFDFRRSFANLGYTRKGSNSILSFSARYRESNLEDEVIELDPGNFIIDDAGTLKTSILTARLQTGLQGPFGLDIDGRYRDANYSNTADPGLNDETQSSINALARFSLSPSLSLRARAGAQITDANDPAMTKTEDTYVGIGLQANNASGLSFTGDLLFDRTEVTTNAPSSTSDTGVGIDITLAQAVRNGSVGALLSSRVDENGRRTEARVNRSITMPTGGLSLSLGVVDQEGINDLQVVGGVQYNQNTSRGALSASVSQSAATNDGDTVISTDLKLAYSEQINATSGWQAGVGYTARDELFANTDKTRKTATIAYNRNLTPDWTMQTGLQYQDDDGTNSQSVFFNIQRDITFGF